MALTRQTALSRKGGLVFEPAKAALKNLKLKNLRKLNATEILRWKQAGNR